MNGLTVVRVARTVYGAKITVESNGGASAVFDSFLGCRRFSLRKGWQLTIRVKGHDWTRGEVISMGTLVGRAWDWSAIPWEWD